MSILDRARGLELSDRVRLPPWQLVAAAIFALAYLGWFAYTSADRGVDRGLGVLVAWPVLALLAVLVAAPFVAIGWLAIKLLRDSREDLAGCSSAEADDEKDVDAARPRLLAVRGGPVGDRD